MQYALGYAIHAKVAARKQVESDAKLIACSCCKQKMDNLTGSNCGLIYVTISCTYIFVYRVFHIYPKYAPSCFCCKGNGTSL